MTIKQVCLVEKRITKTSQPLVKSQTSPQDKDIHGIILDIKCVLGTLEKNNSETNWKLFRQYYQNLTLDDIANSTIRTTLRELNRMFHVTSTIPNIRKLSKDDVNDVLFELRMLYPKGEKDDSYFNHVSTLKIFLRWVILGDRLYENVGDPYIITHIKLKKPKSKIQQKDLITFTQYKSMINSITNLQDRALLAISYEGGLRAGEVLAIDVADILVDELGARISVNGKTGKRDIRVMRAARYLYEW